MMPSPFLISPAPPSWITDVTARSVAAVPRATVKVTGPGVPAPRNWIAGALILEGVSLATVVTLPFAARQHSIERRYGLTLQGWGGWAGDIARGFGATPSHAIWVINAYQIATLVMLLPLASLGDLFGYRRVYLVGMALFTAASLAAVLANSLGTLIAARAFQGLGAAGIMSVNAAMVRLIYPSSQLGRGMAINSMVVAKASVAGPSVAAAISSGVISV